MKTLRKIYFNYMIYIARACCFSLTVAACWSMWFVPLFLLGWMAQGRSLWVWIGAIILTLLGAPILFKATIFLLKRGVVVDGILEDKLK